MDRHDFCRALARDAGKLAHRAFGTSVTTMKGRHDVVTAMDREVERFIRAAIAARFPRDAIIGEEEGGGAGDHLWLIDPIDGTANYARGLPRYCVSIGYLERGVPVLGAIYDPSHDWLYSAASGEGAWRDGERLAVSPCAEMTAATVECGWSTRRQRRRLRRAAGAVLNAGARDPPRGLRRAGTRRRRGGLRRSVLRTAHQRVGLRGRHRAGARSRRVHQRFLRRRRLTAGNPLIATNAALCAKLAAAIGISTTS